jgi:hypothetical protein
MAFVYRSERAMKLSDYEDNELGPGVYMQESKNQIKESTVPFGSSSPKIKIKHDQLPGPGSYFVENRCKADVLVENQAEPIYRQLEKRRLNEIMTKPKRFSEDYSKADIPGPGYYYKDVNKFASKRKKSNNIKYHPNYDNNRISSIPLDSYGYYVDMEGNLIKNRSPVKIYKGEKEDVIGPDRYEVVKSSDWAKNFPDWSKSLKDKAVDTRKLEETETSLQQIDPIVCVDRKKHIKKSIIKAQRQTRKKMQEAKESQLKPDLIERLIEEQPGPGYYYNENAFSSFKPKRRNDNFEFGSHERRNLEPIYVEKPRYVDEARMEKKSLVKKLKKNKLLIIKEKRKISIEKPENVIGPGYYNIEQNTKKSASSLGHFGSLVKRFPEKKVETVPGPGAYNNYENEVEFIKYKKALVKPPLRTSIPIIKEEETMPAVGSYNPRNSIEYNVMQKAHRFNKNIPFNAKEERFIKKVVKDGHLGPGYYYKEKKKEYKKKVLCPIKKYKSENSFSPNIGPGQYELESYFDWNKKSYNILFV